jgi:DNA (cytosine-5)-methyltransferase 1
MNAFSELRQSLGLSKEAVGEFLDVPSEKIEAYELGTERPAVSALQALKGFALTLPKRGANSRPDLGTVDLKSQSSKPKQPPRPQSTRVRSKAAGPQLRLVPAGKSGHDEAAPFTFIDLFAGIGGMRRGFETVGGKCIFTCEWDRYSQQTYRANFPDDAHEIAGDICEVNAGDIPVHDVLLAGFPCQPFSIAGVSKKNALNRPHGFACEAQGTLFFDVARIIKHRQPKAFLLENVKNLVNHDGGRTFRVIRDVLTKELGYHISFRVIDAKPWVPQHRERIFIAGFRDIADFTLDTIAVPDRLKGPKLESILHGEVEIERAEPPYTSGDPLKVSNKYTLTPHLWNYLREYAAKHREAGNGFGFGLFGPDDIARTLSARYFKDGSEILIRRRSGPPRRLTPRECARLMGFDAPGKSGWKIPVSDTQAYRQFGNAVVVPAVAAVARHMTPYILDAVSSPSGNRASA